MNLTVACANAGFGGETLPPEAEEALAKIAGFPAPFPDFATALRTLAAGEIPPISTTLPPELQAILTQITEAIRNQ